jgi:hypothetical protein
MKRLQQQPTPFELHWTDGFYAAGATVSVVAIGIGLANSVPLLTQVAIATGMQAALPGGNEWDSTQWLRGSLFVSLPSMFGVGLLAVLLWLRRFLSHQRWAAKHHRDKPWMANPQWTTPEIAATTGRSRYIYLYVLLAYLAIVIPAGLLLRERIESISGRRAIVGFLIAFGLLLAGFARIGWIHRRWMRSILQLQTWPGVIGGPFIGVLRLCDSFPEGTSFRVMLQSVATLHTKDSDNDSTTSQHVIWQDQQVLAASLQSDNVDETLLPIYFAIPFECESVSKAEGSGRTNRSIDWRLTVRLANDRDLRELRIDVPVYRTAESSATYREDQQMVSQYRAKPDIDGALQRNRMRQALSPEGDPVIEFSLFSVRIVVGCLIFIAVCVLGVVAAFRSITTEGLPWVIAAFASLAIGAALYILIQSLLLGSRITVRPESIEVLSGFWGWRRSVHYRRDQSLRVGSAVRFHTQQAGDIRTAWIADATETPSTIAWQLRGRPEAEALCLFLQKELSLTTPIEHGEAPPPMPPT